MLDYQIPVNQLNSDYQIPVTQLMAHYQIPVTQLKEVSDTRYSAKGTQGKRRYASSKARLIVAHLRYASSSIYGYAAAKRD